MVLSNDVFFSKVYNSLLVAIFLLLFAVLQHRSWAGIEAGPKPSGRKQTGASIRTDTTHTYVHTYIHTVCMHANTIQVCIVPGTYTRTYVHMYANG